MAAQVATNITFHNGEPCRPTKLTPRFTDALRLGSVDGAERTKLLSQKGITVWFTGLSASGKVCHTLT